MEFGREVCGFLPAAEQREWLVTNGIGGFAMGTIPGLLTRSYHGLLIAALTPPVGRTLLLTKIDELVQYLGREYPIFVNRWQDGTVEPDGYSNIESFRLEGATPVWTYSIVDALLEKRIWMENGSNTTYIRYTLRRGSGPMAITAKVLVNCRDFHQTTKPSQWEMDINALDDGLNFRIHINETSFFLRSTRANFFPRAEWYKDYYLSQEAYRRQDTILDSNFYAGHCNFHLGPSQSVTLVASTEDGADLEGAKAMERRKKYEDNLLKKAKEKPTKREPNSPDMRIEKEDFLRRNMVSQLILAADQFIVERKGPDGMSGRSIIAGYPWFSDWGRDTMIALPGLCLVTGRWNEAAKILTTFSHYVDKGQLPNRFPDAGEEPEYNTVDATLWYFEAIRAYYAETGDEKLVSKLFPILEEIIHWHVDGTRYGIKVDPQDGLIYAGQSGIQLTWMDAKVDDWVVTPRAGKPIEVNALWFNAINIMIELCTMLEIESGKYQELADRCQVGFNRFWNEMSGYCFDLLDGPDGSDAALRPNQLLAVSLPYNPLTKEQQRKVVDSCSRYLLTSFGLRSLGPDDDEYIGSYGGDQRKRDGAYHQGTVWGWLIGPYLDAHLKVYGDKAYPRAIIAPFFRHLTQHGLGSISEIFDGDAPHTPRGCPAQAWSVAEVLRIWHKVS